MSTFFNYPNNIILRQPQWNIEKLYDLSIEKLKTLIDDDFFMEALWLASPVLHSQYIKWLNGELKEKQTKKLLFSLIKYYQRLSTRTTPFGLFAGNSVVPIGKESSAEPCLSNDYKRFTRLDMEYVCSLIKHIDNDRQARKCLRYKANSSLYKLNDDYRYVEYHTNEKNRNRYSISQVSFNEYLEEIIKQTKGDYIAYERIMLFFSNNDIEKEDAEEFLNEIIDSQILVSSLEPSLTCDDPVRKLIHDLKESNNKGLFSDYIEKLEIIVLELQKLDYNKVNKPSAYTVVVDCIQSIGVAFDISKIFQVDISCDPTLNETINDDDVLSIIDALRITLPITSFGTSPSLTSFAKKFRERYDEKEVRLTAVLDSDIGIGYPVDNVNTSDTPLVDSFSIKQKTSNSMSVGSIDTHLYQILQDAAKLNKKVVDIETELKPFINKVPELETQINSIQPSVRISFSKIIDEGKEYIDFDAATGNSALDTLARFAHTDKKLADAIENIAQNELESSKGFVLAEVIHLPESRTGNVLLRPNIYQYQIPFIGGTSVNKDNVIAINDLYISVKANNKIFLRSKKLDKYILPRLCNAHNFVISGLPIYRFLCELQNQSETRTFVFDWGGMKNLVSFHPRVVYRNVILSRAKWFLNFLDIATLIETHNATKIEDDILLKVEEWRKKHELPKEVFLMDHDRELFVNFNNNLSVRAFLDEVKNKKSIVLKELYKYKKQRGVSRANKFFLPLYPQKQTVQAPLKKIRNNETIRGKFLPGSEVLFLKIYGGNKILEEIFLTKIFPMLERRVEVGIVRKWFFMRFNDPEHHIRLRIFFPPESNQQEVLTELNGILSIYINNDVIWKCNIDTYVRELERYKGSNILVAEEVFYFDSIYISQLLNTLNEDVEGEQKRWLSALQNINNLFDISGFTLEERSTIMRFLRKSFFQEFGADKSLQKVINDKYRSYRSSINEWINPTNEKLKHTEYEKLLEDRALGITNILVNSRKEIGDDDFTSTILSYIHMTCNRLFLAQPRKHELLVYDFLDRYYKSEIAQKNLKVDTVPYI